MPNEMRDDYIRRSLSKLRHKRWEYYIVSRIYNRLNDLSIEFVCQQLIRRGDGTRAFTDMYFPQFDLHLEIDECHHAAEVAQDKDQMRERDIVDATGHEIIRIRVYDDKTEIDDSLEEINEKVEKFVMEILNRKNQKNCFSPWDFNYSYGSERNIDKGYLDAVEGAVFRYQADALKCFGYCGGNYQRGTWTLSRDPRRTVWFPRLYSHGTWKNSLQDSGNTIITEPIEAKWRQIYEKATEDQLGCRVVFGRYEDMLGRCLYRFLGQFELDRKSIGRSTWTLNRTATRISLPLPIKS